MVKFLLFNLIFLLGCLDITHQPQELEKSKYYNNLDYQLDSVQKYFEENRGAKFKRDFKDFVVFYFHEDQKYVNLLCRSKVDVAGCIDSYWIFVILDHPDPNIRCQAVLHETIHMALAQTSDNADFDYGHTDELFNTFVFDPNNCGFL